MDDTELVWLTQLVHDSCERRTGGLGHSVVHDDDVIVVHVVDVRVINKGEMAARGITIVDL